MIVLFYEAVIKVFYLKFKSIKIDISVKKKKR